MTRGKHRRKPPTRWRGASVLGAAIAAVAVVVGVVVVTNQTKARSTESESAATPTASATASAPVGTPTTTPVAVTKPAVVTKTTPSFGASGADAIVVNLAAPLVGQSLPTISPQTPGVWSQPTPTTWRFTPVVPFAPGSTLTVTAGSQRTSHRVTDGSLLRAQQLLADLHYLPLNFTPSTPISNTPLEQGALAFDPPDGTFTMRFATTPAELSTLWAPGESTAMTKGAVMAFENLHHLEVDGVIGPTVWSALLQDAVAGAVDPQPYTWAWTTMSRPETLHIWSDGTYVFTSRANTGISAAKTPKGSWPVFSRFRTQTMRGTNPDGSKYNDPGVPFISYFYNGDAIHGFPRASYGSPQSLGCIELPYAAAKTVWGLIDYGTVVTVSN